MVICIFLQRLLATLEAVDGPVGECGQLLRQLALDAPNDEVRIAALRLLGKTGDADAVRFLKEFPVHRRYGVIAEIIKARRLITERLQGEQAP